MRNLDPARAKRERDIDHLADPVDVGAMHYGVHGEQQLAPSDFGRKRPLAGKRTVIPGDVIGGICTWSSPASVSAPRVLSVIPTAEVTRLM